MGGDVGAGDAPDQRFVRHAEIDEVGDGHDLQIVLGGEDLQIRHSGHRAVVLHHLADDSGRFQPRQAGQIDGTFRLAGPDQNSALFGPNRKDMPRTHQIFRLCTLGDGGANGRGAVVSGDARCNPLLGLNGHGEGRPETGTVVPSHGHQPEAVGMFLRKGKADQTPAVHRHEIDGFGGDELGGHAQVALVFSVLVVHEDDHFAIADILNGFLD